MSFPSRSSIWAPSVCSLTILCNLAGIYLHSLSVLFHDSVKRSPCNSNPASHCPSDSRLSLPSSSPHFSPEWGCFGDGITVSQLIKKAVTEVEWENAEKNKRLRQKEKAHRGDLRQSERNCTSDKIPRATYRNGQRHLAHSSRNTAETPRQWASANPGS